MVGLLSEQNLLESIYFINGTGINTSQGGKHVDVVARQISQFIVDYINTKMFKESFFLCVNSLIENP